jgi:beta-lactamase class A
MTKTIQFTFLFLFFAFQATAQTTLLQKIEQIVASKNAVVGVSISDNRGKEVLSINGKKHFPFQSVFKFHIALAVLSEVDKGKFSLDQKIEITKKEVTTDLYSPIKDKYPEGATLTLAEILQYTVSASDNVGCDILLRLIGGPQTIENYFVSKKFKDISIKLNEQTQQAN